MKIISLDQVEKQKVNMEEPTLKVELTQSEVNTIMDGLAELKLGKSLQLFQKMIGMISN